MRISPTAPVPDGRPARRHRPWWANGPGWPGAAELRTDRRSALLLTAVLTLTGVPAGLLWVALAPRAQLEVVDGGAVVLGRPSAELLAADDAVFTLVLAAVGLLAAVAAWQLRSRRGVAVLLGLAVGTTLAGVLAWQVGELVAGGPSEAELATVGAQVTSRLDLGSLPALAVAPFVAVLGYVVAALFSPSEDLGRRDREPGATLPDAPTEAVLRERAGWLP